MSGPPLRVAVTRDETRDGPLARALERHGLHAVACPVVREAPASDPGPLDRAARALERYDWLVVASARAVAALVRARAGAALPSDVRTAAVGRATAAALVAAGARAPLIAEAAGADGLAAALRDADRWPGRAVLAPRARDGRRTLVLALRGWGARVDDPVAYRTVARPAGEVRRAWRAARPGAAVVTSPGAARALVRALGPGALMQLVRVAAIGATTAAELRALGVPAVASPQADFAALAALVAAGEPLGGTAS